MKWVIPYFAVFLMLLGLLYFTCSFFFFHVDTTISVFCSVACIDDFFCQFLSMLFRFYLIYYAAFFFSFFLPLLWFLCVVTFVVLLTLPVLSQALLSWWYCWCCYCFPDLVGISWYCCCFPNIADISWYWRHFLMQRMFSSINDIFIALQMFLVSMLLGIFVRFVHVLLISSHRRRSVKKLFLKISQYL